VWPSNGFIQSSGIFPSRVLLLDRSGNSKLWLQLAAIMQELVVDAVRATRKNGKASLTMRFISLYSLLLLASILHILEHLQIA